MTVAPPPDIILTDGPFLKNSGPAGRNLSLLGSFLPLTLAGVVIRGPATLWPLGLTLAGAFGGLTLFAARRREALGGLDWAVWAWLAAVTVAFAPPDHEPYAALSQGLILGFIAGRPRCARLAALPGLSVLMSAAVLMAVEAWGGPAWLHVGWRITDWPSVVLLAVSGLCFSPRLKPAWRLAAPWLAFAAVFAAVFSSPYGRDFLSAGCPMAARASSLALPAFFVAPFLARSAIQLGWCAAVTLEILIFIPSPLMSRVEDMPTEILAYLALVLLVPLAALPAPGRPASAPATKRAKKAAPQAAATAGPAAPAFKAGLKCGHGGQAPRLSRYRGLESCRLAAGHDGGPLACPYGCLALGDCV
ncbi:MAG: hypothetical protein LBS31_02195, partial [Candidatus Adiutrix sp.]|nr:hypothetical protein [Candidatus Adiutrix sp.]